MHWGDTATVNVYISGNRGHNWMKHKPYRDKGRNRQIHKDGWKFQHPLLNNW